MKFHLEFNIKPRQPKISINQKIFLAGSCFTENIGDKLAAHKFQILQNPHGILFNPVSVANALDESIKNNSRDASSMFHLNESFHSWDHHSRFSSATLDDALNKVNQSTNEAHEFLKNADVALITLGSAWVYELTAFAPGYIDRKVAANNHKAPSSWFNRKLLTVEQVKTIMLDAFRKLREFNPGIDIILTISPVRHLREGFIENNRSKAALVTAIHEMLEEQGGSYYFPAYELVIDDLRDYRFYAEDLVHPNYAATNYVWDKFVKACIDEPSQEIMHSINEINAAKNHKPFNAGSVAHGAFKAHNLQKLEALHLKYPFLDFTEERIFFS